MKARWVVIGILASLAVLESPAWAQSRPLKQLPQDMIRWSTVWWSVPQGMIDMNLDHGPLIAVTWGPVKGTADALEATTQDLWNAVKPESYRSVRYDEARAQGVILQYTF